jgi:hypothetical protein
MRDFVRSRLFLPLVAFVTVGAAVVVALVTYGAVPSYAESAGVSFNVVFTSVACSSPLTIITVDAGGTVSGTAELKSNGSGHADQGASLLLQEAHGQDVLTIATIAPNSGAQSFKFTAASNNTSLTACITGNGGSDLVATVSGVGPSNGRLNTFNLPSFLRLLGL